MTTEIVHTPVSNPARKSFLGNGANGATEFETGEEFAVWFKENGAVHDWTGVVFQECDLSDDKYDALLGDTESMIGCHFWGCKLKPGRRQNIVIRGATVFDNPVHLPFKPFRAFLYSVGELITCDDEIYQFHLKDKNVDEHMFIAAHDFSIQDALLDYCEGKSIAAVMGGHQMQRSSAEYQQVVELSWLMARAGLIVATGGGPGAMEAANLGAYLVERDDWISGLDTLRAGQDLPLPQCHLPSLGIPTWWYGHEPFNHFAAHIAKFFTNSIREDQLLQICRAGVIFTPGSFGTVQEIFQSACRNAYIKEGLEYPMVFLNTRFWKNNGSFDLLLQLAKGKPFAKYILLTDSAQEACQFLIEHAKEKGMPLLESLEQLKNPYWISAGLCQ